jgi:hypothetical protein
MWDLDAGGAAAGDADGVPDAEDCAAEDPDVWSVPGEVPALSAARTGSTVELTWGEPAAAGGTAPAYDVVRSASPDDFQAASSTCIESGDTDRVAADGDLPAEAFFYLVRAVNPCGAGTSGVDSAGAERAVRTCP